MTNWLQSLEGGVLDLFKGLTAVAASTPQQTAQAAGGSGLGGLLPTGEQYLGLAENLAGELAGAFAGKGVAAELVPALVQAAGQVLLQHQVGVAQGVAQGEIPTPAQGTAPSSAQPQG